MCLQHDWLIILSVWRGSSAHPLWRDDERARTTYDNGDGYDDGYDDDGHVDGPQVRNMDWKEWKVINLKS